MLFCCVSCVAKLLIKYMELSLELVSHNIYVWIYVSARGGEKNARTSEKLQPGQGLAVGLTTNVFTHTQHTQTDTVHAHRYTNNSHILSLCITTIIIYANYGLNHLMCGSLSWHSGRWFIRVTCGICEFCAHSPLVKSGALCALYRQFARLFVTFTNCLYSTHIQLLGLLTCSEKWIQLQQRRFFTLGIVDLVKVMGKLVKRTHSLRILDFNIN